MPRSALSRVTVVLLAGVSALSACSSSSKKSSSPPTTVATTAAVAPTTSTAPAPSTTVASGPTTTAAGSAVQAAYLKAVDPTAKTITFLPIKYLTGDAAKQAWQQDHPGAVDGPPNDYYIVHTTPATQTLPVAPGANLHHLANVDDPNSNATATLATLAADPRLATEVFFLTIGNGQIEATRQQFTP